MATYTKLNLSGSTNGKNIKVTATTSTGTTIHTAVAGTSSWDEIWLYAINTSGADCQLNIEWGETTDPDGQIIVNIPYKSGLFLVIPGLLLQNGLIVKAYAGVTNVININGFVNRIS